MGPRHGQKQNDKEAICVLAPHFDERLRFDSMGSLTLTEFTMNFEAPPIGEQIPREEDELLSAAPEQTEESALHNPERDPDLNQIEKELTDHLDRLEDLRKSLQPRVLDYYKAKALERFDDPNEKYPAAMAMSIYGLTRDNAWQLLRIPHYDDRVSRMKTALESSWAQTHDQSQSRESISEEMSSLEHYVNRLVLYTEAIERGENANLSFMRIFSPEEFYEVAATEPEPDGTVRDILHR